MSTMDTLAKKYQQKTGVGAHCFDATAKKKNKESLNYLTFT